MKKNKKESLHQIRFLEFVRIVIAVIIFIVSVLFLFDISHVLVCYPVVFLLFAVMCACMAFENTLKSDKQKWLTIVYTIVCIFFSIVAIISGIQL